MYRSPICDSCSYAGTETTSDHRLVVSHVHLSKMYKLWHTSKEDGIAMSELVHQKPRCIEYIYVH